MTNKIYNEHCLDTIKKMPDKYINSVVTSPPYWGLRDYGTGKWIGGDKNCSHRRESKKSNKTITGHETFDAMLGVGDAIQKDICKYCGAKRIDKQLGLEKTPEEYVNKLVEIFREIRRMLRDDGTVWLNLGSSMISKRMESEEMVLRDDLTPEERKYVFEEITKTMP